LGGDRHLLSKGSERFTQEFFVCERTIGFGGVEKSDATFDGRPDQRNHFLLVACRTVARAHSHTAEPQSRDFQVAISKFAPTHYFSLTSMRFVQERGNPVSKHNSLTLQGLVSAATPEFLTIGKTPDSTLCR